jgi:hypothetical protein
LLSAATLAADPPDSESARVAADAAASETAAEQTAQETEAHATSSARETDREPGLDAKERKRGAKEHKANLTSEAEAAAALPGGPGMVEQKCTPQRLTGTHIWRIVCISPAQQQANDKAAEQQAKDYLRRLSEQGTIAPAIPNRYITSGPF